MIMKAREVNKRCFEKKNNNFYLISSPASDEVDENEKNKPRKNKIVKQKNIFLSIFLQ